MKNNQIHTNIDMHLSSVSSVSTYQACSIVSASWHRQCAIVKTKMELSPPPPPRFLS